VICAEVTGNVTISPPGPVLAVGDSVQFSATLEIGDPCGPTPTIQWHWASMRPSVLAIDSISGLAFARDTGQAMVTAVPSYDPTVTGATTATVHP
jgi:hypothetical protein